MQIRQAERTEFDAVRRFYHAVIDAMEGAADGHASDAPRCAQGQSPGGKALSRLRVSVRRYRRHVLRGYRLDGF